MSFSKILLSLQSSPLRSWQRRPRTQAKILFHVGCVEHLLAAQQSSVTSSRRRNSFFASRKPSVCAQRLPLCSCQDCSFDTQPQVLAHCLKCYRPQCTPVSRQSTGSFSKHSLKGATEDLRNVTPTSSTSSQRHVCSIVLKVCRSPIHVEARM